MKASTIIGEETAVYNRFREQFCNILIGKLEEDMPVSRRRFLLVSVDLGLMLIVVAIVAVTINLFIFKDEEATASTVMPQAVLPDETSQFAVPENLSVPGTPESAIDHTRKHMQASYRCPLHPEVISDKPGACVVCGEPLIPVSAINIQHAAIPEPLSEALPAPVHEVAEIEYFNKPAHIEVNEHRVRSIQFNGQGWVENLVVKTVGNQVKRGDLLLEVYSPKLVDIQLEYLRALTRKDMVELTIAYDSLMSAGQTAAQIQRLNQVRQADGLIRVYSPADGLLSSVNVSEGMFVPAASEVLRLLDLSSVWMVVELTTTEAAKVVPGQQVEINNGAQFKGEVSEVLVLGEADKTYVARLRFDDEDQVLRAQKYIDVRIYAGKNYSLTRR
jgi:hypothetical protein